MSTGTQDLQERCTRALATDLQAGGEVPLHEAYELGREALTRGTGVLEMVVMLWRAARGARSAPSEDRTAFEQRLESILLECLSPFEMALRGVREANQTLRLLEERREDDARRIARELHDQAGQLLATVHLALEGLRAHLAPEGEPQLLRVMELRRLAEEEIRRLSHELRPLLLDDLGLVPALQFLGEGVARRWGFTIEVIGSTAGRLPRPIETAVYRSVQEALNNVARHAHASSAVIELRRTPGELCCHVRDDGRGFDPGALEVPGAGRGLGLGGIRERLAPLGGHLVVTARPGLGTELRLHLPLEVSHANPTSDRG